MNSFKNKDGRIIMLMMIKGIQNNKTYLGDVDGLIGDGDHGMNMSKGFTLFQEQLGDREIIFSDGLTELSSIPFNKIGDSMGPIYGTIFSEMGDCADGSDNIDLNKFVDMLQAGLYGLYDIVEARPGDKTLVDTLHPALSSLNESRSCCDDFKSALENMKSAADRGMKSTVDMVARFGRSSRLGERSKGVQDAGATACCIILNAMADGIIALL